MISFLHAALDCRVFSNSAAVDGMKIEEGIGREKLSLTITSPKYPSQKLKQKIEIISIYSTPSECLGDWTRSEWCECILDWGEGI